MAINFLNTVDLNQNQLDHARIVNEAGNVAAGTGVAGQLYFDTTADAGVGVLKVWTDQWVEVGGGVESLTNTSGTYVAFGTDNVSATGAVTLGTVDLTAVDGTSVLATRFLSKDNTWDVPAFDNYSGWILDGDSGIAQTISSGNTALFTGGTKITTSVAATDVLTITHDAQAQTDTTSAVTANAFTVVNSVGVDSTGHVTGVDIKTVTVPDNNTTYDLTTAPTGTAVRLTDSASVNDDVTISGTTGRTAMSRINASELRVDLTDSVTIVDDLTIGGIITQSGSGSTTGVNNGAVSASANLLLTANNTAIKVGMQVTGTGIPTNITIATVTDAKTFVLSGVITIADGITITFEEVNSFAAPLDMNNNRLHEVKTGLLGTDGVNLGQVELLVAGVGVFKGGYNATTDPGVPIISGASNIALDQGDYFVVTAGGDITFSGPTTVTVEVGDFIFANAGIAANSNPAASAYTIVIADDNIATANTTAANTQKGVAGFDSAYFNVTTGADAGWVQLNPLANPHGASVTLTSGVDAGGETTFTVDVTALFGATASAANCKAEVLRASDLVTVYPEVSRNGTGDILFKFVPVVADSAFKALITIV